MKLAEINGATTEIWKCKECGCTEVEAQFWVKLNTAEVTTESDDDTVWCPYCEEHVPLNYEEDK
jgi:hypothetical protein